MFGVEIADSAIYIEDDFSKSPFRLKDFTFLFFCGKTDFPIEIDIHMIPNTASSIRDRIIAIQYLFIQ